MWHVKASNSEFFCNEDKNDFLRPRQLGKDERKAKSLRLNHNSNRLKSVQRLQSVRTGFETRCVYYARGSLRITISALCLKEVSFKLIWCISSLKDNLPATQLTQYCSTLRNKFDLIERLLLIVYFEAHATSTSCALNHNSILLFVEMLARRSFKL